MTGKAADERLQNCSDLEVVLGKNRTVFSLFAWFKRKPALPSIYDKNSGEKNIYTLCMHDIPEEVPEMASCSRLYDDLFAEDLVVRIATFGDVHRHKPSYLEVFNIFGKRSKLTIEERKCYAQELLELTSLGFLQQESTNFGTQYSVTELYLEFMKKSFLPLNELDQIKLPKAYIVPGKKGNTND